MDSRANESSDTKDSSRRNNKLSQQWNWRALKVIVPRNLSVNTRNGRLRFGQRKRRNNATAGSWPRRNNARFWKGNGRAARQLGTRTTNLNVFLSSARSSPFSATNFSLPSSAWHFLFNLQIQWLALLIRRSSGTLLKLSVAASFSATSHTRNVASLSFI